MDAFFVFVFVLFSASNIYLNGDMDFSAAICVDHIFLKQEKKHTNNLWE